jgi:hypothetical protein
VIVVEVKAIVGNRAASSWAFGFHALLDLRHVGGGRLAVEPKFSARLRIVHLESRRVNLGGDGRQPRRRRVVGDAPGEGRRLDDMVVPKLGGHAVSIDPHDQRTLGRIEPERRRPGGTGRATHDREAREAHHCDAQEDPHQASSSHMRSFRLPDRPIAAEDSSLVGDPQE